MSQTITRIGIAPVGSPSYRLNRLRFHLFAYTVARNAYLHNQEARFYIRCDDTDSTKSKRDFLYSYLSVLERLGVKADKYPYDTDSSGYRLFQSERTDLYKEYLQKLLDQGLAYSYQGAFFFDTHKFAELNRHHLRDNLLTVRDSSMGELRLDIRSQTKDPQKSNLEFMPFPIVRSNGEFLFNFCSPIDDAIMGVTHIVRDRDKLDLLAKQEMIRISLGLPEFTYIHAPLLVGRDGKRFINDAVLGEATFQNFIERGFMPQAIVSYLLSGFYGPSEMFYETLDAFAERLDITKIHKSNVTFSQPVLSQHNKKAIQIATDNEYKKELEIYMKANNPEIYKRIAEDPTLEKFLLELRRRFGDVARLVDALTNQTKESLPPNQEREVLLVANFISERLSESSPERVKDVLVTKGKENAVSLGLSFPNYCKALEYLLLGKIADTNLRDVVNFLEGKKEIWPRIMANQGKERK